MQKQKITLSFEELNSPAVNAKLEQQDASQRTREHFERRASVFTPGRRVKTSIWYNTLFYMAFFGLLGGVLGWAGGAILQNQLKGQADLRDEAGHLLKAQADSRARQMMGELSEADANRQIRQLDILGESNVYYRILKDDSLSPEQKEARRKEEEANDANKKFIANVLSYGLCGVMIAVCLAMAEHIVSRNLAGAVVYGSVGAVLGLIGGIAVSLFIENVYTYLHGSGVPDMPHQLLARAVTWGVLGLFLAMAPGLVMRNFKKLSIGVVGGLLGGIVGGLLFDPVDHFTHNVLLARLVGTTTIGLVIGLSTGLIESVAKSGWLKVIEGLIAGKQFILYRNPTYIGSAPNCDIYLFKDHQVGRRHAAIHVVPGGFDLENLPLGSATLVNSQPIARARLKHGDQIQIGNTVFTFQEKARAKQRA